MPLNAILTNNSHRKKKVIVTEKHKFSDVHKWIAIYTQLVTKYYFYPVSGRFFSGMAITMCRFIYTAIICVIGSFPGKVNKPTIQMSVMRMTS